MGACILQVELARQTGVDGSPAGAQVAGKESLGHTVAPSPVPRGLERETSLPSPFASEKLDSSDNTYERVGTDKLGQASCACDKAMVNDYI